jgi:hypothetical protein
MLGEAQQVGIYGFINKPAEEWISGFDSIFARYHTASKRMRNAD